MGSQGLKHPHWRAGEGAALWIHESVQNVVESTTEDRGTVWDVSSAHSVTCSLTPPFPHLTSGYEDCILVLGKMYSVPTLIIFTNPKLNSILNQHC